MFLTLHRYILRELVRIFVLATIALTLILSVGSILRPIQEYGVGPHQVARLMVYFMPVMLTFVLPLAALFAASLTYGRFAGDNEIDACKASGVSPLTLIYPGFILALLVAMANLALSFHVMPSYIRKAERTIKDDAKQILFRNIQKKGYYQFPHQPYTIYADNANAAENILSGVVVIIDTAQRKADEVIVTEDARVSFTQLDDGGTEVRVDTYNIKNIGGASDTWFNAQEKAVLVRRFGSALEDKIRFKSVAELKRILADPLSFPPIGNSAEAAVDRFALELLHQDINEVVSRNAGSFTFDYGTHLLRIAPSRVALGNRSVDLLDGVEAEEIDRTTGKPIRKLQCEQGALRLGKNSDSPSLTLTLDNVSSDRSLAVVMHETLPSLALPKTLTPAFAPNRLNWLLQESPFTLLTAGPSQALTHARQYFVNNYQLTHAEIRSEIHTRLVFGLGCIPMILIGIGMGILKRGGHALSAFASSCLPALVLVVGIVSGKQLNENMTASQGWGGIALIWSGLVVLCLIWLVVLRKLVKN
jgi:lipopolysaccharide export LptBFGC system permease protein LptF